MEEKFKKMLHPIQKLVHDLSSLLNVLVCWESTITAHAFYLALKKPEINNKTISPHNKTNRTTHTAQRKKITDKSDDTDGRGWIRGNR